MPNESWECEHEIGLLRHGYKVKPMEFKSVRGQGQKQLRGIVSTIIPERHLPKSVKSNKNKHCPVQLNTEITLHIYYL